MDWKQQPRKWVIRHKTPGSKIMILSQAFFTVLIAAMKWLKNKK